MEKSNTMSQGEIRRLAAIMFTDIVGFSRQMGTDESRTLRLLAVHNQIIQQAAAAHNGTVIKTVGDGFLVDFPSIVHAVQCAQQIQAQFLHTTLPRKTLNKSTSVLGFISATSSNRMAMCLATVSTWLHGYRD